MRLTLTLVRLPAPVRLLAITLIITLAGCSALGTYQIADQNDIDQWLKNHQYGRALNTLNLEATLFSSKETQKKLKIVKISASKYDRTQAAKVLNLVSKDKWEEALNLLNTSLQNHPDGKQLPVAKITIQRQSRMTHPETQCPVIACKN